MATIPMEQSNDQVDWNLPSRGTVAMASLIIAESSIFTIFIVAYLFYLGRDTQGPKPREVLEVPIFYTVCLLSSSFFIWLAERAIDSGKTAAFRLWWSVTILLGAIFLYGTATEWRKLIVRDQFTISTNLFGTTYYSLVGLHATHVVIGLIMMLVTLALAGAVGQQHAHRVKTLALYWHFVDVVWIVVFTVVYVVGR